MNTDDVWSRVINLPFTFCYFGNSYNACIIGANGQMGFDLGNATAFDPWSFSNPLPGTGTDPDNDAKLNAIMGTYYDINPAVSGSRVDTQTYGVAPCRVFVASWYNVGLFSCTSLKCTQQIAIYEATNNIEVIIRDKPVCASWNGGLAITGIMNAAGTSFYVVQPPVSPINQNGTQFTLSNVAYRFTPAGPATPWTYTWTGPGGVVVGSTPTVVLCPTVTTNYTFTMSNSACGVFSASAVSNVTVGSLLPPISGPNTVCAGGIITLSNPTAGGTWSSGNPSVATVTSGGVVSGVTPGTAVITYSWGSCNNTHTVTVTATPITGVPSTCARGVTQLSNPVTGGVWSITPASVATIDPTTGLVYGVDPPGSGGGGGNALVTYVNPSGCKSTVAITIHPTPPLPAFVGNTAAYCQYFTPVLPLSLSSVSGVTPTWYVNNDTTGQATAPTPTTFLPGQDTFSVKYTSAFGCVGDLATFIVTVDPKPTPPTTYGKSYCEGETNITPLDQQVSNYTGTLIWFYNGVELSGVPAVDPMVVTYPYGTTWHVSQQITAATTCRSDSVGITDTIKNVPDFNIDTRPWICQKDSMMLKWQNMGMAVDPKYFWQLPDDAYFSGTSVETDRDVQVRFDSFHSHNFVYLTVSDLGCVAYDTVDIKVVKLPTASSQTKNDLCMSDTAMLALSAKSSGAERFIWLIDGTPLFSSTALNVLSANTNEGGPFKVQWIDTGKHIIQLQTLTVEGCTSLPVRDTVNVRKPPVATFKYTPIRDHKLCLDDSVRFVCYDSLNTANMYVWTPEHSFNNVNSPIHWGRVELPHQVIKLTVTDPFGCVSTYDQELDPQPCCLVPFPNAFSPNGDGHNDVFRPIPMGNYHRYHFFRIANRWGQTIFSSTDNQIAAWDGTLNGVPQDIGVYYYYLKYDCDGKLMEVKGDVTLVK